MPRMIFVHFVRLDQKRVITYSMNVFFPISFGNILRTSGLRSQVTEREEFTFKDVFVGRLAEDCDLLNYFFILAKFHIWTYRKRRVIPNLETFIGMVDAKYRTESYKAAKNNRRKKFQAKWQKYIDARDRVKPK